MIDVSEKAPFLCSSCGLPKKHYGKGLCKSCWQAAWNRDNPELVAAMNRRAQLKGKYGLTEEDFLKLLEKQGGRCAICGTDQPGVRIQDWCVDHDHETEEVRGLLCQSCNFILGLAKDSIQTLAAAIRYLRRTR